MEKDVNKRYLDIPMGGMVTLKVAVPDGMRAVPMLVPKSSVMAAVFVEGVWQFPQPNDVENFVELLVSVGSMIQKNRWPFRRFHVLISSLHYTELHDHMGQNNATSVPRFARMAEGSDSLSFSGPVPAIINMHRYEENLIFLPGLPVLIGHKEWPSYYKMSNETL